MPCTIRRPKRVWRATGASFRREAWPKALDLSSVWQTNAEQAILARLEKTGVEAHGIGLNTVALVGSEEARGRAERVLASCLTEVGLARASIELPWEELATRDWFDPVSGEIERSALPRAEEDFRFVVLESTPLVLMRGVWSRFLAEVDVEIAQAAAIFEPIIGDIVRWLSH